MSTSLPLYLSKGCNVADTMFFLDNYSRILSPVTTL